MSVKAENANIGKLPDNFSRLVGTLNIESSNLAKLKQQCAEMKELDYYGVYFNNIFFTVEDVSYSCHKEDILFREDKCLIVRRPEKELKQIRNIIEENGLPMPSAHFLNMLPEPGTQLESIFKTHEKILDMAEIMGAKRLTSHVGGIAVPQAALAKTRPTPAERLDKKEIAYEEYARLVRESYGKENIVPDSILAYRHLCGEAAKRKITITIETACTELYDLNTKPEVIIDFIGKVGAANLGICIDAGHCHLKHLDIPEIVRRCGSFFLETHFHDNFADRDRHCPVGIGTINWLDLIKAMHKIGYKGEITFEQGDYVTNHKNWMLFIEQVEKDLRK